MNHVERDFDRDRAPSRNTTQLAVAGILLAIPVVALLWVDTYARTEPTLAGFPFFIWYQFLWVFLCSACTWTAYHLVQISRPHRPSSTRGSGDRAKRKEVRR